MDTSGKIQSVDRALMIIKLLAKNEAPMKLTEIAEELDINKSTIHGIISTLKYHGFVDQDDRTQKYSLGVYLIGLGEISSNSLDITRITTPIIEEVSRILEETVHLGKIENSEVVYIDKKESKQSMRIYTSIGDRKPAYCTGVGKIMLAYFDEDKLKEILPENLYKLTTNTVTDKNKLIENLKENRENGYSLDNEEYSVGLTCVAAPIFDHSGKVKYGISVSGPTVRMTEDKIKESIKLIKDAAKKISKHLGYREIN